MATAQQLQHYSTLLPAFRQWRMTQNAQKPRAAFVGHASGLSGETLVGSPSFSHDSNAQSNPLNKPS